MKSSARREKSAKKCALAQVSQLQEMLQSLQMSTNASFMTGQPVFGGHVARPVQPMFFGSMLQNAGAVTTIIEDDSIESVIVPEDLI